MCLPACSIVLTPWACRTEGNRAKQRRGRRWGQQQGDRPLEREKGVCACTLLLLCSRASPWKSACCGSSVVCVVESALIVVQPFLYDEWLWAMWTDETNNSPCSNYGLLSNGASIVSCLQPLLSQTTIRILLLLVHGAAHKLILLYTCSFSKSVKVLRRGSGSSYMMNDLRSLAVFALWLELRSIPPFAQYVQFAQQSHVRSHQKCKDETPQLNCNLSWITIILQ